MLKEDISIIIVNYNSAGDIKKFLDSFIKIQSDKKFKFYIYNNYANESDLLKQLFSELSIPSYIYNSENIGFGAAVNFMARIVNSDYILIVNPDCLIIDFNFDSFFNEYFSLLRQHKIGFFAPTLLDSNFNIDVCYGELPTLKEVFFRTFFLHKLFKKYYFKNLSIGKEFINNQPSSVPYPCGAFLLINKDVFLLFNGFNKRYFAYFEETDLSLQFSKKGLINMVTPNYRVIHYRGNRKIKSINNQLYTNSQYLYFFSQGKSINLLLFMNLISIFLRIPVYGLKNFIHQVNFNFKSYINVRTKH